MVWPAKSWLVRQTKWCFWRTEQKPTFFYKNRVFYRTVLYNRFIEPFSISPLRCLTSYIPVWCWSLEKSRKWKYWCEFEETRNKQDFELLNDQTRFLHQWKRTAFAQQPECTKKVYKITERIVRQGRRLNYRPNWWKQIYDLHYLLKNHEIFMKRWTDWWRKKEGTTVDLTY